MGLCKELRCDAFVKMKGKAALVSVPPWCKYDDERSRLLEDLYG
jgi:hypothetical protein